jgi:hypothetical protein
MTSVDTYHHPDDDGHLPDQFRLMEIAMLIHNNAKHRIWDVQTPRIHHVTTNGTFFNDNDDDDNSMDDPHMLVQGYTPRVNHVYQQDGQPPASNPCQNTPRFGDRYGNRGGGEQFDDRGPPISQGTHGGTPVLQGTHGRYTRPDQRRRPFKPGVQCVACKRLGHEAVNCDMLAIALFIDWYTKQELTATNKDRLEQQWLTCWKEKLGMPARTPRQVMQMYCDVNNITEDFLAKAMDWECWPESDPLDDDST